MIKKILNSLLVFVFTFVVLISSYALGLTGNIDYNKTFLYDVVDSISGSNNFAVLNLDRVEEGYNNWTGFTHPYNYDFLYHSAAVRVSNDLYTIKDKNSVKFKIALSDFEVSSYYAHPDANQSLLLLNSDIKKFEENSIILKEEVLTALSIKVGDKVYLPVGKGKDQIKLTVAGSYRNREERLNRFYYEVSEATCFVSPSVFDQVVGDGYQGYLGVSNKTNQYKKAYYTEITPLLSENNISLSIDNKFSQNNFKIKEADVSLYQEKLLEAYKEQKSNSRVVFLKIMLTLNLVLGLICLFSSVHVSFRHFPKWRLVYYGIFALCVVGVGMLIATFGPALTGLVSGTIFEYSFILPLQLLTVCTIVVLVFGLFHSAFNTYFDEALTEYRKNSLKSNDVLNRDFDSSQIQLKSLDKVENISEKRKILFFGSFVSPDKSAGAIRVLNFAKMAANNDLDSYIASYVDDYEKDVIFKYSNNIFLIPFAKTPKTLLNKIHLYINPRREVKKILYRFKSNLPKCIVVYSVFPLSGIRVIRKFCKKNNVKLVFDVVESHSLSQQKFTSLFSTFFPNKIQNNFVIKRGDNVIAISSHLKEKFNDKECKTIQIPFINDVENIEFFSDINQKERSKKYSKYFLYVGNPTRGKDLLTSVIKAFTRLEDDHACLIVAGVNDENLMFNEKITKNILLKSCKNVVLLGKVPHEQIKLLYSIADYSILIRNPNKESAKAGFPTKVSESLSFGVPVIANITSDLGVVLNQSNSVICEGSDSLKIKESIEKAIRIASCNYKMLRLNARKTAKSLLNTSTYEKEFIDFILNKV